MAVTMEGMVIEARFEQRMNIAEGIVVMLAGTMKLVRLMQCSKTMLPTLVTLVGKAMLERLEQ